ncbi:hypothetical protein PanWU01x14_078580 [Parasponia andersonii]|uniref:Uncharacterized protein n=1 Tax=Parasponia andersonii TaxID=3476 RepID=A0A2P5DC32_PARAD|nr:hypothetical protein PanWU01x14_078580 [Parasponia andersonii]
MQRLMGLEVDFISIGDLSSGQPLFSSFNNWGFEKSSIDAKIYYFDESILILTISIVIQSEGSKHSEE